MIFQKNSIHRYLTILLLTLFALGQGAIAVHNFSHQHQAVLGESVGHNDSDCTLCSAHLFGSSLISPNSLQIFVAFFAAFIFFLVASSQHLLSFKESHPTRAPPFIS